MASLKSHLLTYPCYLNDHITASSINGINCYFACNIFFYFLDSRIYQMVSLRSLLQVWAGIKMDLKLIRLCTFDLCKYFHCLTRSLRITNYKILKVLFCFHMHFFVNTYSHTDVDVNAYTPKRFSTTHSSLPAGFTIKGRDKS